MGYTEYGFNKSHRIVTITNTNSTYGTTNWKKALSSIIALKTTATQKIIDSTDLDADVDLLMEADLQKLEVKNNFIFPVDLFIKDTEKSLDKATGGWWSDAVGLVKTFTGAISAGLSKDTATSASLYPWFRFLPAWQSSASTQIVLQYPFKFRLGQYNLWDAYKEVVKPTVNLMSLSLPRYVGNAFIEGPFPNTMKILDGINSNIVGALKDIVTGEVDNDSTDSSIAQTLLSNYSLFTYTIRFGNVMTFYNMVATGCTVDFSKEVDTDGNPIASTVTMIFKGVVPVAVTSTNNLTQSLRFGNTTV